MTGPEATLPVERTALAWRRTAVAVVANAVMLAKLAVQAGWGWRATGVVPLCGLAAMAVVTGLCLLRDRQLRRANLSAATGFVAAVAIATAAVGVSVVIVVMAHVR
jgi:uncharacterized membrane protein YidH (DUF202 family)